MSDASTQTATEMLTELETEEATEPALLPQAEGAREALSSPIPVHWELEVVRDPKDVSPRRRRWVGALAIIPLYVMVVSGMAAMLSIYISVPAIIIVTLLALYRGWSFLLATRKANVSKLESMITSWRSTMGKVSHHNETWSDISIDDYGNGREIVFHYDVAGERYTSETVVFDEAIYRHYRAGTDLVVFYAPNKPQNSVAPELSGNSVIPIYPERARHFDHSPPPAFEGTDEGHLLLRLDDGRALSLEDQVLMLEHTSIGLEQPFSLDLSVWYTDLETALLNVRFVQKGERLSFSTPLPSMCVRETVPVVERRDGLLAREDFPRLWSVVAASALAHGVEPHEDVCLVPVCGHCYGAGNM